jgi:glycosyltransferase involved in cell wall biosynthesis
MKIGIDARNYFNKNKSGVDYYVKTLVDNIARYDSKNQYYFFFDFRANKNRLPKKLNNVRFIKIPLKKKYSNGVDFASKLLKLDFVHYTAGGVPQKARTPYMLTIYDLTFEIHPEFYTSDDLKKQKLTRNYAKNALGVISISKSTKADLIREYNIESSKIEVTHLAFNKNKLKKYKYKKGYYFLFVGNLQPRKNLIKILGALSLFKIKNRPKLVIAGNIQDDSEFMRVLDFIKQNRLENYVSFKGYVSEKELDKLYRECMGVIYPSIYEGFGYNILEAFYYKKPLITSNISSMPEIAKNAAVYVNPSSEQSIKNAMMRVVNDKNNNSRIVKRGSEILKEYSVDNMIKVTLKAYEKFGSKK